MLHALFPRMPLIGHQRSAWNVPPFSERPIGRSLDSFCTGPTHPWDEANDLPSTTTSLIPHTQHQVPKTPWTGLYQIPNEKTVDKFQEKAARCTEKTSTGNHKFWPVQESWCKIETYTHQDDFLHSTKAMSPSLWDQKEQPLLTLLVMPGLSKLEMSKKLTKLTLEF